MARKSRHNYKMLLAQFNMEYGVDESKLKGCQRLCADCGLQEVYTIRQCKKNLRRSNINILDLLYAKMNNCIPMRHRNRADLIAYTQREGMCFPKNVAKNNGFLKGLLVNVF